MKANLIVIADKSLNNFVMDLVDCEVKIDIKKHEVEIKGKFIEIVSYKKMKEIKNEG